MKNGGSSYFSLAFPIPASYNIWIGKSKPMEVSIGLFSSILSGLYSAVHWQIKQSKGLRPISLNQEDRL
ncbi:hypothetical protein D3Z36_04415 [Lachnospiraceae bacterium]|nr:hypothetical protein [Lachnospiraceae bacterium]